MRWFIYSYPSRYGGRYGVYDCEIVENISYDDACEEATSLCLDVIDSYMRPDEEIYTREEYLQDNNLDEWNDSYEDDYWDILSNMMLDEVEYEVYQIKESTSDDIIRDFNMNRIDPRDFIKDYCIS